MSDQPTLHLVRTPSVPPIPDREEYLAKVSERFRVIQKVLAARRSSITPPSEEQRMKQPEDLQLRGLVMGAISVLTHSDTLFVIDKNYQIVHTYSLSEFGTAQATQMRQRMLSDGTLLAIVMVGWAADSKSYAVCETYPAPGQVETYTLSFTTPSVVWSDQDEPDAVAAIQGFKKVWSLANV